MPPSLSPTPSGSRMLLFFKKKKKEKPSLLAPSFCSVPYPPLPHVQIYPQSRDRGVGCGLGPVPGTEGGRQE